MDSGVETYSIIRDFRCGVPGGLLRTTGADIEELFTLQTPDSFKIIESGLQFPQANAVVAHQPLEAARLFCEQTATGLDRAERMENAATLLSSLLRPFTVY